MASTSPPLNIADGLATPPGVSSENVFSVIGDYEYWYYGCDGVDDRGWGCGYRTFQTLCSWVRLRQTANGQNPRTIPSINEIQEALVTMEDKQQYFKGSREWIGSIEVALCVDYFFDVPCKILHIASGKELVDHMRTLEEHFENHGAPIMMGGDSDSASKGILGVCRNDGDVFFLVLDPHYYGQRPTQDILKDEKFLLWRPLSSFIEDSFYNLCLPQFKL